MQLGVLTYIEIGAFLNRPSAVTAAISVGSDPNYKRTDREKRVKRNKGIRYYIYTRMARKRMMISTTVVRLRSLSIIPADYWPCCAITCKKQI